MTTDQMRSYEYKQTTEWTPARKILLLALIAAAVLVLPYFVRVEPAVSLSYVTGFSNRTAVVLFMLGAGLFAYLTRGKVAEVEENNSALSRGSLYIGVAAILLVCFVQWYVISLKRPDWDGRYFVERQQLLAAGLHPYTQFEFAYGPLLLYPNLWLTRLLHISPVSGYYTMWAAQWVLGTLMIWSLVRSMDFPVRIRSVAFYFLVAIQLCTTVTCGENYTPFRMYFAAFAIWAAHWTWKRTGNVWWFSASAVLAVWLAMACSAEQALGIATGLGGYFLLLAYWRKTLANWSALALFAFGSFTAFFVAAHLGLLVTLQAFAHGGYLFPLLFSPAVLFVLFSYLVAGCMFYRCILTGRRESVVLPLTIGGCGMLSAALGRCDTFHLFAAAPAFLVGVIGICAMPAVRRWWLPITCISMWLPTLHFGLPALWHFVRPKSHNAATMLPKDSNLTSASLPCDRQYYSPTLLLPPSAGVRPECLDKGYYFDLTIVTTPELIERKIAEMKDRPSSPLLLDTRPLEEQFVTTDTDPKSLRTLEVALFVPRRRNPPLTYGPIIDYVRNHYAPGPLVGTTGVRIWYPVPSQE